MNNLIKLLVILVGTVAVHTYSLACEYDDYMDPHPDCVQYFKDRMGENYLEELQSGEYYDDVPVVTFNYVPHAQRWAKFCDPRNKYNACLNGVKHPKFAVDTNNPANLVVNQTDRPGFSLERSGSGYRFFSRDNDLTLFDVEVNRDNCWPLFVADGHLYNIYELPMKLQFGDSVFFAVQGCKILEMTFHTSNGSWSIEFD